MANFWSQVDGIEYDADPAAGGGASGFSSPNPKLGTGRKLGAFGIAGDPPTIAQGDYWYDSTNKWHGCCPVTAGTRALFVTTARDSVLTADTGSLTSTTAADITGLSFAVAASGYYVFEANLRATSSTTAGVKYAITFPAGGTMTADLIGTGATNVQSRLFDMLTASGTLSTTIFQQLAALGYQKITGVFKNGTNAGTLQLQYAKVTSGNVIFGAGSAMVVRQNR